MAAHAHTNYAHRKTGRQEITPIHPELADALEPILGNTHHLFVYQEQLMAIARRLAGYTLGGADLLRRAMGKKKPEVLAEKFHGGMRDNGYSQESITYTFDHYRLEGRSTVRVHTGHGRDTDSDLYQDRRHYVWDNRSDTATLRNDHGRRIDSESWGHHRHGGHR
ncbi:lamin tail domain-containing protein [Streptomyces tibetensis]|uniref:lamin tail domain-containing protein n=1 Tax=Streptomyces tibetensis TaxID=2382123 RepID=UPI0033F4E587